MKTIVTHFAPDVDAITSVWLLNNFLEGWEKAQVKFVPAGKTLDDQIVDSDPEILHVDTGMGILDHHQTDEDTCAARRTLEYIKNIKLKEGVELENEALERMIDVVNDIDHFREVYYPNPNSDYHDFGMAGVLDGWKLLFSDNPFKITELGKLMLDGIYKNFQNKVWAESEIKVKGIEFKSKWGKALAVETINDEVLPVAQKMGYGLAVRKDAKKSYVRIKALPDSKIDLTKCYNIYRKLDKKATWFLHASKKMILNGSIKNPQSKPTSLTLREIVEVLKKG